MNNHQRNLAFYTQLQKEKSSLTNKYNNSKYNKKKVKRSNKSKANTNSKSMTSKQAFYFHNFFLDHCKANRIHISCNGSYCINIIDFLKRRNYHVDVNQLIKLKEKFEWKNK